MPDFTLSFTTMDEDRIVFHLVEPDRDSLRITVSGPSGGDIDNVLGKAYGYLDLGQVSELRDWLSTILSQDA